MAGKRVTMIVFQFSVVMKGIEKKLVEAGYEVSAVSAGAVYLEEELKNNKDSTFIIYLSDDTAKMPELSEMIEMIDRAEQKLILIGEKDWHEDFEKEIPVIGRHEWMDRPVEMEELEALIDSDKAALAKKSTEKKRILIVDDDPSYAKMVREWLKDLYRIDIVTAGMKALSFLLKNMTDLVLLDYEMPVVDGPKVLEILRNDPNTSGIPVVFLTGVGSREGVAKVLELKPDGYILKSSKREEIVGFLKKKLD